MKKDWDLLRKILTDIEEELDPFAEMPTAPARNDQDDDAYMKQLEDYRAAEEKLFWHLEYLVNSGHIVGLKLIRLPDGSLHYSKNIPRLTMAGDELLETMRASLIWESIKEAAATANIELTFDAIKSLGVFILKKIVPN